MKCAVCTGFCFAICLSFASTFVIGGVDALDFTCGEVFSTVVEASELEGDEGVECPLTRALGAASSGKLSDGDLAQVAGYVVGEILATGRTDFDDEEIEEATGVSLGDGDGPAIRQAVIARLRASEAGRRLLAGSRCQAYDACSLYGDLSGASGEILAMYEREKAEDGRLYDDFRLPEFTARDLEGREVGSSDLLGSEVLLAFVAVHCRHSMDSLPILERLTETYGSDGLRVVAVAVNSGSVEDVRTWFPSFEPSYEVWVADGDALGDRLGSHLVPTYLFVDRQGRVTEKRVGYQEPATVTERVLTRLAEGEGGA